MLIAHLTDFHCVPPGEKLGGRLDVNLIAAQTVATITGPEFKPDLLIVTGDLTHGGDVPAMKVAREALEHSHVPCMVIPGGHDTLPAFRKVFPDHVDPDLVDDRILAVQDYGGLQFVAINTMGDGELPSWPEGASDALGRILDARPDMPTVVVLHHPPFQCHIAVKTYYADPFVKWAAGLKQVIAAHPQVRLMPCGHVHRAFQRIWAGALVSSGSSTCVQSDPDFSDFWETVSHSQRNVPLVLEPPYFHLYHWDGEEFANYVLPAKRDYPRV